MSMIRFRIVTPCRNAADTIDETIASVVGQRGAFTMDYHVQDGGSTDGTLEKIQRWAKLIESGTYPLGCEAFRFTFSSDADSGMYDAINRGFSALRGGTVDRVRDALNGPDDAVAMSWINADDRLNPGALQTAAKLFMAYPQVEWLGGRHSYMDADGCPTATLPVKPYSRPLLATGLYEGRRLFFIQQEGIFWRAGLWQRTGGGLRRDLRLAGDLELWCRFAAEAEYLSVDTALATFRVSDRQASADLAPYYAELDRVVAPLTDRREALWAVLRDGAPDVADFMGNVAMYDGDARKWRIDRLPCFPGPPPYVRPETAPAAALERS